MSGAAPNELFKPKPTPIEVCHYCQKKSEYLRSYQETVPQSQPQNNIVANVIEIEAIPSKGSTNFRLDLSQAASTPFV